MRVYVPAAGTRRPGGSVAVPPLPRALLDRHGARELEPGTAYRTSALLTSRTVTAEELARMNQVLAGRGLRLSTAPGAPRALLVRPAGPRPDGPGPDGSGPDGSGPDGPGGSRSGAVGIPARDAPDAWTALRSLRAALPAPVVDALGLDHLLRGCALWPGWPGYPARLPVDLPLGAPASTPYGPGRRPVIAILDTGVGLHPWFTDDFLTVFDPVQAAVARNSAALAAPGTPRIVGGWDEPLGNGCTGSGTHHGQGTFVAGLIRQSAPIARVRSARVIHGDGAGYESDLVAALHALADETTRVRSGEPGAHPVDIVSLSLGYYPAHGAAAAEPDTGEALTGALDRLTSLGVIVVAAAGSSGTGRPYLPAALAPRYVDAQLRPRRGAALLSVGALNPNGSVAVFSADGPWVSCFATAASVVSTVPVAAPGGSRDAPPPSTVDGGRQGLNTDDYASGFAVWSGTSFAAPVVAARIAVALYQGAARDHLLSLDLTDSAAALRRCRAALARLAS